MNHILPPGMHVRLQGPTVLAAALLVIPITIFCFPTLYSRGPPESPYIKYYLSVIRSHPILCAYIANTIVVLVRYDPQ